MICFHISSLGYLNTLICFLSCLVCLGCVRLSLVSEAKYSVKTERSISVFKLFCLYKHLPSCLHFTDIIGQSQDTVSTSLEEDKRKSYCLIILGIVQVLLNYLITDLEKQPEGKKGDIRKEIVDLIEIYESLEKDVGKSKQGNIGKRLRFSSRNKSDDTDVGNASINEEREKVPFLSTSSIYQLFQVTFKLYSSKSVGNLSGLQDHSQLSSAKTEKSISSVFSFTLHVCVGHIRSSLCMKEENPLKPLVYGDMKVLGPPLLKVVYLLKPGPPLATGQTNKENKGRKDAEGRKQCLHLALLSLKELLNIYSSGSGLTSLLEDLLAVPASEDATLEDCSEASKIEDPLVKSIEIFMEKIMKPMITDLIAQNSNDVEVNSFHFQTKMSAVSLEHIL